MKKLMTYCMIGALSLVGASQAAQAGQSRYGAEPPFILAAQDWDDPLLVARPSNPNYVVVQPGTYSHQRQVARPAYRQRRVVVRRVVRQRHAPVVRQRVYTQRRLSYVPTRRTVRRAPPRTIAPRFLPQIVSYRSRHKAGTIIVDTNRRFLYLVLKGGKAKRYGVGVGRPGFEWAGTHKVTRKAQWPSWRPPAEMLRRAPELPRFMPGGPANPLGARALYLGSTLYRIHGSNEPWTIGRAVSSGCIRMRNQDVIDLYQRTRVGTRVIVL